MTTRVMIPGTFTAHLDEHGAVVGYTFMPSESDAGYFGGGSFDADTGEPVDSDPDGQFWTAVRESFQFLHQGDRQKETVVINVPVTWEE